VIWVLASVILQEGSKGFLNGQFTTDGSLLFSATAFALTAVLFGALRCARSPTRRVPVSREATLLLVLMNVLTAVCFLGVYVSMAWVPSALVSGWVAAVGPLAVAVAGLAGAGRRPTPGSWLLALCLFVVALLLAARLEGTVSWWTGTSAAAIALMTAAGAAASGLALVSRRLAAAGVDGATVMAHRFHLTYVVAFAVLAVRDVRIREWAEQFPEVLVTAVVAVALPLYLLQIGLQRVEAARAMSVLAAAPAVTYTAQTVFGGSFDPVAMGAVVVLASLVFGADVHARRSTAQPGEANVGSRPPPGRFP
jgi:drug/metabolite transporter (DMT)-like permease